LLEIIIYISLSLIVGFIAGRKYGYKIRNYGVTKKMFLILERAEIDRRIQMACDLEDYEEALCLKKRMENLDRKIKKIKLKESKKDE
jgi:hypothetical protein